MILVNVLLGFLQFFHAIPIMNPLPWFMIVLPMHFSRLFRVKYIVRRVMEVRKSGTPCFFVLIPTIKYYRT